MLANDQDDNDAVDAMVELWIRLGGGFLEFRIFQKRIDEKLEKIALSQLRVEQILDANLIKRGILCPRCYRFTPCIHSPGVVE